MRRDAVVSTKHVHCRGEEPLRSRIPNSKLDIQELFLRLLSFTSKACSNGGGDTSCLANCANDLAPYVAISGAPFLPQCAVGDL